MGKRDKNASGGGGRGGRQSKGPSHGHTRGPKNSRTEHTRGPRFHKEGTPTAPAFSLQEEARNTSNRHNLLSSDIKLRNTRVAFVSAGQMERIEPVRDEGEEKAANEGSSTLLEERPSVDAQTQLASMSLDDGSESTARPRMEDVRIVQSDDGQDAIVSEEMEVEEQFVIDMTGSAPVDTGIPPPQVRADATSDSDSDEDVVLFAGRNRGSQQSTRPSSRSPRAPDTGNAGHSTPTLPRSVKKVTDPVYLAPPQAKERSVPSDTRRRSPRRKNDKSMGQEIMTEYIENLKENGELDDLVATFGQRELDAFGVSDSPRPDDDEEEDVAPRKREISDDAWDSSDLRDFDDMSTSANCFEVVEQVLSKRERPSGLQYLVVWQGYTVDDARWIPHASLSMEGAHNLIQEFEAQEKLIPAVDDTTEESSTSESIEDEAADIDDDFDFDETDEEEEDQRDQEDLVQRMVDRMTDEKIAEILAKQEELGIGSEEIMLFDGLQDEVDSFAEHLQTAKPVSKRTPKGRKAKRSKGAIPSASQVADAYDDFDVMDWERPSLHSVPKRQKGAIAFDLSDPELEETLQATWTKDRDKKKTRKREREELRSMGLLGKGKQGMPDLRMKYSEGMGVEDVKTEIKVFLMSERETLPLPPMKHHERRIVHEMANSLGLKSKSVGDRTNRFPTLYKTSRSARYSRHTPAIIEDVFNQRRFLPRMGGKGKRAGGAGAGRGRGGGGKVSGVTYRDGEVVGAAAPELGAENRGRAMLEKMGWSSGNALGAMDNKGILQPVAHVVKVSKAGLG